MFLMFEWFLGVEGWPYQFLILVILFLFLVIVVPASIFQILSIIFNNIFRVSFFHFPWYTKLVFICVFVSINFYLDVVFHDFIYLFFVEGSYD